MRVIVMKDQDDKFLDISTDTWSSRVAIVERGADPETIDARFSAENYDKLHSSKKRGE